MERCRDRVTTSYKPSTLERGRLIKPLYSAYIHFSRLWWLLRAYQPLWRNVSLKLICYQSFDAFCSWTHQSKSIIEWLSRANYFGRFSRLRKDRVRIRIAANRIDATCDKWQQSSIDWAQVICKMESMYYVGYRQSLRNKVQKIQLLLWFYQVIKPFHGFWELRDSRNISFFNLFPRSWWNLSNLLSKLSDRFVLPGNLHGPNNI